MSVQCWLWCDADCVFYTICYIICVYIYACYTCTCDPIVCMSGGTVIDTPCLPLSPSNEYFEAGSLIEIGAHWLARKIPVSTCLLPLSLGNWIIGICCSIFLCGSWGSECMSSYLCIKFFIYRAIFLAQSVTQYHCHRHCYHLMSSEWEH